MMRLNDLKNFIEISTFPSLSLAARKLEVTQPALSESIKRLEADLGYKVFYRTKNGIALTPAGKTALEKAKEAQYLLSSISIDRDTRISPTITLGCHPTIGSYFLPQFFKITSEEAEGYKIQLNHALSRDIQREIQSGKIDIGVVVNPLSSPDLIIKPFVKDTVYVWKSRKGKIQDQIIADTDLFQTQSILKKWKKAPKNIVHTNSLDLIARMTKEGCGYGIIPERIIHLLDFNLTKVPNTPSFRDQFCLVYRPEFGKSDYEKKIIDAIIRSF